jgi:hypothetical protein
MLVSLHCIKCCQWHVEQAAKCTASTCSALTGACTAHFEANGLQKPGHTTHQANDDGDGVP